MSQSLQALFDTLPQVGKVEWLGIRPTHQKLPSGKIEKMPMAVVEVVEARAGKGLTGDRYATRDGKRQVTLFQWEHLSAIGSMLGRATISPELLRRNIAVSGINLLALKGKQFRIGTALLEYTGLCDPCSAMETTFGPGGYNALRGHGGITARIIESGVINLGAHIAAAHQSPRIPS